MAYVSFRGVLGVATSPGALIDGLNDLSFSSTYGDRLMAFTMSNGLPQPDLKQARIQLTETAPGLTYITSIEGVGYPGSVETVMLRVAGLIEAIPINPALSASAQLDLIVPQLSGIYSRMLRGSDTIELSGLVLSFWGDHETVTASMPSAMGHDLINATAVTPIGLLTLFGDAKSVSAGATAHGGNDIIKAPIGDSCRIFGDFETILGNATFGNDTIFGSSDGDQIYGDSLVSGAAGGNDVLLGLLGDDDLFGGGGNDTLIGEGGADTLHGGAGTDTASYHTSGIQVTADLLNPANNTQHALNDTYISIENLTGTRFSDTLRGNNTANALNGGAGDDTLEGNGGNDTLIGGVGVDTLRGGTHNDIYVLENGTDNVIDTSGIDRVTSTINRALTGLYAEVENLTLLGNAITGAGNASANSITGNAKNNTLDGAGGNDILSGLGGHDTLIGNAGRDTLTGGAGNDTFRFLNKAHSPATAQRDTISDFDDSGNDRIDVSALFSATMTYRHDQAFTASGQVRINDIAGTDLIVEVNTGGSLAADFSIRLKATTLASMAQSDFVL